LEVMLRDLGDEGRSGGWGDDGESRGRELLLRARRTKGTRRKRREMMANVWRVSA
jgi:hypothetical protein